MTMTPVQLYKAALAVKQLSPDTVYKIKDPNVLFEVIINHAEANKNLADFVDQADLLREACGALLIRLKQPGAKFLDVIETLRVEAGISAEPRRLENLELIISFLSKTLQGDTFVKVLSLGESMGEQKLKQLEKQLVDSDLDNKGKIRLFVDFLKTNLPDLSTEDKTAINKALDDCISAAELPPAEPKLEEAAKPTLIEIIKQQAKSDPESKSADPLLDAARKYFRADNAGVIARLEELLANNSPELAQFRERLIKDGVIFDGTPVPAVEPPPAAPGTGAGAGVAPSTEEARKKADAAEEARKATIIKEHKEQAKPPINLNLELVKRDDGKYTAVGKIGKFISLPDDLELGKVYSRGDVEFKFGEDDDHNLWIALSTSKPPEGVIEVLEDLEVEKSFNVYDNGTFIDNYSAPVKLNVNAKTKTIAAAAAGTPPPGGTPAATPFYQNTKLLKWGLGIVGGLLAIFGFSKGGKGSLVTGVLALVGSLVWGFWDKISGLSKKGAETLTSGAPADNTAGS